MSASELKPAIEKLLKRAPSRKELNSLVMSVDDSMDGTLQYPEFLKLVSSSPPHFELPSRRLFSSPPRPLLLLLFVALTANSNHLGAHLRVVVP